MMMHSLRLPFHLQPDELHEWAVENCRRGFRIEPGNCDMQNVFTMNWEPVGPTLFINEESDLVHAKLRFC